MDEARRVAEADPTVTEHRNMMEVMAWRGPAGIGDEYRRLHRDRPETPEGMGVHPFVILRRAGGPMDAGLRARRSEYWESLRAGGKVAAAGAVEGDSSAVEIVIFRRISDEEARRLGEGDPGVKREALRVKAHRWWCAANVFPR